MKNFIEKHEQETQRLLEIFTGLVPWFLVTFPIWGSLLFPRVVAFFVLVFLTYWLYRSLSLAVFAVSGYLNIKAARQIDWQASHPFDLHHILILPNYKERLEKLRETLKHLASQTVPKTQLTVVLAMEEREGESAQKKAEILTEEFKDKFAHFWTTFHKLKEGEVVGKSSNEAFAAKFAKRKLVDELGLDINKVTITTCDADAVFPPQYFASLGVLFSSHPKRHRRIWQAPIFPYNNIRRVTPPIRIMSILGSGIFLSNLQRPSRTAFNYSTYSASLSMFSEVGFWDADVIPEDWHMFLKCFFNLGGKVQVEPLHLPVYIDAAESFTLRGSLINRYEQCKREAWGATDIPYAIREFFKHPEIPLAVRLLCLLRLAESHFLWSANWFLLTLGAAIPTLLNPEFSQTVLGHNLPRISQAILTLCLLGLAAVIAVDNLLQPGKALGIRKWCHLPSYLEWLLLPLSSFFLAALPGLDAHTRLMLGKYLEYKVTEKI